MGNFNLNDPPAQDVTPQRLMLRKDGKPISRVNCYSQGLDMRDSWTIMSTPYADKLSLPSEKFLMTLDSKNAHQAMEWTTFLHFLFDYKKVAVVEPAAYDFYILPPHVRETDKVEVAFRKRNSAFHLESTTHGNHFKPCKLEEEPGSRIFHPHKSSKFIFPVSGHDAENGPNSKTKMVQSCNGSSTSLEDSLLSDSLCLEDDPGILNSVTEYKNILCTSPATCLEEIAESSRKFVKETPISPTRDSSGKHEVKNILCTSNANGLDEIAESSHKVVNETQISSTRDSSGKHHYQFLGMEPSLKNWETHSVSKYSEQIKFSESQKDSYMKFAVDGNLTKLDAAAKQFRPLSQSDILSSEVECTGSNQRFNSTRQLNSLSQSHVRVSPSFFKTLGQSHSGWIFGAIAELVDNARDASAKRLDIKIEKMYSKREGKDIYVLSFVDDGCGMSHEEIVRMVSFGHKGPEKNDINQIGRYGVGFKTGAMRLGRNALVLSQASKSRSVAFVSQAFNEDKENFEIPIVSYGRQGSFMDIDTDIHTEAEANAHLNSIKEFSPFNEYLIGQMSALFEKNGTGTGTQIYIWDLDKWGSDYSLEWNNNDIMIRSRRVRARAGQFCTEVLLDHSLCSYLEVIFLEPRMQIKVQEYMVKVHPLAESLCMTAEIYDFVIGKPVHLTLGHSNTEWERRNCGIFLYWHGRLIEAYKRVGGMIHSADMGRGILGVVDVTDLMNDQDGKSFIHSNKQGFVDCEAYAMLEDWLGRKCDEYWDTRYDDLFLVKANGKYKPHHEWVQCNKCLKWRRLDSNFDSNSLPDIWVCNMEPYNGLCCMPQDEVELGVVTVGQKRIHQAQKKGSIQTGEGQINGDETECVKNPVLKRLIKTTNDETECVKNQIEGDETECVKNSVLKRYRKAKGDETERPKNPVLKRLRKRPRAGGKCK